MNSVLRVVPVNLSHDQKFTRVILSSSLYPGKIPRRLNDSFSEWEHEWLA
jgi:hypothetical protein